MAFLAAGAVTLCWLSVSLAAPLACEDLIRPLDQVHLPHFMGRWAFVAESLSHLTSDFKKTDRISINISNEGGLSYTHSICRGNTSVHIRQNLTADGNIFTYDGVDKTNIRGSLIRTSCRDCLLIRLDLDLRQWVHMYLFSRRMKLEPEEMEEFAAQVRCLKMPPPVVMEPGKRLCQEGTDDKIGA